MPDKEVSVKFGQQGVKDLIDLMQQLASSIANVGGAGGGAGPGMSARSPGGLESTGAPHESQLRHTPPPPGYTPTQGGYSLGSASYPFATAAGAAAQSAAATGMGNWVIHAQNVTIYGGNITLAGGGAGAGGGAAPSGGALGSSTGGGAGNVAINAAGRPYDPATGKFLPGGGGGGGGFLGQLASQFGLGGIPGVGGLLGQLGAAAMEAAPGAIAAYGAYHLFQMGAAAMRPALTGERMGQQAYGASILEPLANIPVIGQMFVEPARQRLLLQQAVNTSANIAAISNPNFNPAAAKDLAARSGLGWMDALREAFSLDPNEPFHAQKQLGLIPSTEQPGITNMGERQVSRNYAKLSDANLFLTHGAKALILQQAADMFPNDPDAQDALVDARAQTEAARFRDPTVALRAMRGGGRGGMAASRQDAMDMLAGAMNRYDIQGMRQIWAGLPPAVQYGQNLMDWQRRAAELAQQGQIAANVGIQAQMAGVDVRVEQELRGGGDAVANAMKAEQALGRSHLVELRAQLARMAPGTTAQLQHDRLLVEQQIRAEEAAVEQLGPSAIRRGRYQAAQDITRDVVGRGRAELSTAATFNLYGTPATQEAQQTLMEGLQDSLRNASRFLSDTLKEHGTPGQVQQAQAAVAQAQAELAGAMAGWASNVARDMFTQAGFGGRIAGFRLQGTIGAGFIPTVGQQAGVEAGLRAEITQARQNAANAVDPREQRQWTEIAEQKQAQLMALPLEQVRERYEPLQQMAAAGQQIFGARVRTAQQMGAGSRNTLGLELSGIREAEAAARAARSSLMDVQALYNQGRVGEPALRQAQAEEEVARAHVNDMRMSLGNIHLPTDMREGLAQNQYMINIMSSTPGGYGNWRGALLERMNQLQGVAGYQQAELTRRTQAGAPPEAIHEMREQLRNTGMEMQGAIQQLSFGWEGRVAAMMVGGRGDTNLQGRGFNFRSAVLGGVWNPHMGANANQLPFALDWARWGNIPLPSRPAGARGPIPSQGAGTFTGPFGALPGTTPFNPFDNGWDWGAGGGAVENAPDAGGGDQQLGKGGSPVRVVLSGNVKLTWPDGSTAGVIGSSNVRQAGGGGGDWRIGMDDFQWGGGLRTAQQG